MRKFASYTAIMAFALALAGPWLLRQAMLVRVWQEMREELRHGVNPQACRQLAYPAGSRDHLPGLSWDGADEFEKDGRMYDVVSLETREGVTTVTYTSDNTETELRQTMLERICGEWGHQKDGKNGMPRFNGADFILTPQSALSMPVLSLVIFHSSVPSPHQHPMLDGLLQPPRGVRFS